MPSSPVARAAESTLKLFAGESEVAGGVNGQLAPCHIFSYREDFDYLWGLGDGEGSSLIGDARALDQECSFVLVYDGLPDAPERVAGPGINVRDYVTAYDWAVHFFFSLVAGDAKDRPDVRLFVLDVASQQSEASFAARTFPGLLPLMPWVQVYRLFSPTDLQALFDGVGVGFMNMAAALADAEIPSLHATNTGKTKAVEELARDAWANHLTRPGGRHDVSNLVAPLVLAEGFGKEEAVVQNDPRRAALVELLKTVGVLDRHGKSKGPVPSPLDTPIVKNNIFGQFDRVRFLLVDDQAATGYHDVLASLLLGEGRTREGDLEGTSSYGRFSLRSTPDPEPLLESLFEAIRRADDSGKEFQWSQPRVLDSLVFPDGDSSGQSEAFDVLFLDLRLFGDSNEGGGNELSFLKRLISFYDQSGAEGISDDYLRRAAKAARERVGKTSKAPSRSKEALMPLALFPLLLSYVDPSLPIVLFSSTRQQAVIEAFAHRPSIITSFHKPVVSGYAEGMAPRDYIASLSDAVAEALRLHEARVVWRRIAKVEWGAWPTFEVSDKMIKRGDKWVALRNTTLQRSERGKDEWVRNVYNYQGKLRSYNRHGKPQRNAGEMRPRLRGQKMKTRLAEYYEHYIARANYWDFSVVPSRFFQEGLVPEHMLEDAYIRDVRFRLPVELDVRNHVRRIFHTIRNRVAHGYAAPPRGNGVSEDHRLSSVLFFLLMLDYIEVKSSPPSPDANDKTQRIEHILRWKHGHLGKFRHDLAPGNLLSDAEVNWLDVVAFVACYQLVESVERHQVRLSDRTVTAILRMADLVIGREGAPDLHPDPASAADTTEPVIGLIKWYDSEEQIGFVNNPRPGKDNDIFFTISSFDEYIEEGEEIPSGTIVKFSVTRGSRGLRIRPKKMVRLR